MKWINGETSESFTNRRENWHLWFAWFPVRVGVKDNHYVKVWLEYVERKGRFCCGWEECWWQYDYREVKP